MSVISESHWRNHAMPIIRDVIAKNQGSSDTAIRLALREAYPFGPRKYHPYKIWLDEIARQLGTKPPLGTFRKTTKIVSPDERQEEMFQ